MEYHLKQTSRKLFGTFLIAISTSAAAHDAAHPDTRKKINDAVDRFYEGKNRYRPSQPSLTTLSPTTCDQTTYPKDARMWELEGTTVLSYQVNINGRAVNAEVSRSSGWALLDESAINALSACVFSPEAVMAWQKKSYKFTIN
ncbi:TonB family protein [Pseudoduganella sp. DS3]|uniref:TonB family protein n=1 Tax=Pseudoduganella guangdongensis TaxID=2692179 RepID=A0A6N9HR89_9BURK|nr:TonB family protein [Pseudoduganella guangdongensis]